MVFSYVPWKRGALAGVFAYVSGYGVVYWVVWRGGRPLIDEMLTARATTWGKPTPPLSAYGGPVIPWKLAGWLWAGSRVSTVSMTLGDRVFEIDPMRPLLPEYRALYLVAPAMLFLAGFLVVTFSRTHGPRCELHTGLATVIGFAPMGYVGGLLFTIGHAPTGPQILTTAYRTGLLYPVVFGGLGALVGKWVKRRLGLRWYEPPAPIERAGGGRRRG